MPPNGTHKSFLRHFFVIAFGGHMPYHKLAGRAVVFAQIAGSEDQTTVAPRQLEMIDALCPLCGVPFAVPHSLIESKRVSRRYRPTNRGGSDYHAVYCPNGHPLLFYRADPAGPQEAAPGLIEAGVPQNPLPSTRVPRPTRAPR